MNLSKLTTLVIDLKANSEKAGMPVRLLFDSDIGIGISKACDVDNESDAMILAKAAHIVRKDMFDNNNMFNGF